MKLRLSLMAILVISITQITTAQTAGDFRSAQLPGNNSWFTVGNWQTYNGTSWVAASNYPTDADGIITITTGDSITLSTTAINIDQVHVDGVLAIFSGTFTLNNVALQDDLEVNGKLYIGLNGILDGTGSVIVNSGGLLTLTLNNSRLRVPTVNNGTTQVSGATTNSVIQNTTFTNNAVFKIVSGSLTINTGELINNDSLVILSSAASGSILSAGTTPAGVLTNAASGVIYKELTSTFTISRLSNSGIVKGFGEYVLPTVPLNNGIISPGNSPGDMTVPSNFLTGKTPTLTIQMINSTGPGTGHDILNITGAAPNLSGTTINVSDSNAVSLGSYTIVTSSTAFTGGAPTINVPTNYTYTINSNSIVLNKNSFPLPVVWGVFQGRTEDGKAILKWSTIQELNTSHFVVEYSTDGTRFTSIGNTAAKGNSSSESVYTFTHSSPNANGRSFYRINQVDIDGKSTYSKVVVLSLAKSPVVALTPNPVKDQLSVITKDNVCNLTLTNASGKVLERKLLQPGSHSVDFSSYPTGIYFVTVSQNDNTYHYKLIKN